jgi:hypothetical protein
MHAGPDQFYGSSEHNTKSPFVVYKVSLRGAFVPGTARHYSPRSAAEWEGRCATTLAPARSAGEQSPRSAKVFPSIAGVEGSSSAHPLQEIVQSARVISTRNGRPPVNPRLGHRPSPGKDHPRPAEISSRRSSRPFNDKWHMTP